MKFIRIPSLTKIEYFFLKFQAEKCIFQSFLIFLNNPLDTNCNSKIAFSLSPNKHEAIAPTKAATPKYMCIGI